MRKLSSGSLLLAQLAALGATLHCSSPAQPNGADEGDDDEVQQFDGSLSPGTAPGLQGQPGPGAPGTEGPSGAGTAEGGPAPTFNGGAVDPGQGNGAPGTPAPPGAAPVDPAAPPTGEVTPGAPQPLPPAGTFVERGNWRGFAFSEGVVAGTTLNPPTFDARQPGQPFCLSGNVAAEPAFQGEVAVGFNINQPAAGAVAGQAAAPLTAVPTGTGIALSFSRRVGGTLRVQLQAPGDGAPWCYEIPEVSGVAFAPYAAFNTACWDGSGEPYAGQPIESVKFQVPGDDTLVTPYDFCVNGFADGSSAADAPTDIQSGGDLVVGGLSDALSRVKVLGTNGESYVIQNNAWGRTSSDQTQQIEYSGNSFRILEQSAPQDGSNVLSFPSIFIGANGFQGPTGALKTTLDDNLPIRISDINSVQTRLRHNGGNGDYNVTYDVWFATNPPAGEYETAQAAFLMVWLFKPGNRTAIGCNGGSPNVTVDGRTWRLCVGDRSEGSDGTGGNAPVISYLHEGDAIPDYAFDLNVFIQDAIARGQAGQLNGANFNQNLFLTDVFGGFEIWSGGEGLRVDEFTAIVR